MNFKKLLNTNLLLITQPAKSWKTISQTIDREKMFNTYLYPMIAFCCLATFLGTIFGNGVNPESLYPAIVGMGVQFFTLFVSYHLIAFLTAKLTKIYTKAEYDKATTDSLTCYSMSIMFLLSICFGLFPNFRIIFWIMQFYTVKIVWDGAAVLMRIHEDNRLAYTIIISIFIIFIPAIMDRTISVLTENLG